MLTWVGGGGGGATRCVSIELASECRPRAPAAACIRPPPWPRPSSYSSDTIQKRPTSSFLSFCFTIMSLILDKELELETLKECPNLG